MFISSAVGSRLSKRFPIRTIVRAGLWTSFVAALVLVATIDPQLKDAGFAMSMGLLGVGMGLMASQLGNVVQSSVDTSGRGEAGGLQYTGQQLGSSLGVALIGAIVLAGLTGSFITHIQNDDRINQQVAERVGAAAGTGIDFVSSSEIEKAAQDAGLSRSTTEAIIDDYEQAQLVALKAGLLAAALLAYSPLSPSPPTSLTSCRSARIARPYPPRYDLTRRLRPRGVRRHQLLCREPMRGSRRVLGGEASPHRDTAVVIGAR